MKTSRKPQHQYYYYKRIKYLYLLGKSFIGVFFYSWIVCLASVTVTVLLNRSRGLRYLTPLITEAYTQWSDHLIHTILDDNIVVNIVQDTLTQTNMLFISHLRDFFTLSIAFQFSTPIKGSTNYHYHRYRSYCHHS